MSETSSTNDWAAKAGDLRDKAASTAQSYGDSIKGSASDASDSIRSHLSTAKDSLSDVKENLQANGKDLRETATNLAADLKSQASAHVDEAKTVISSMADEARNRIADIIDQQKAIGADKLSGISRAAQNAASDLEPQNPNMAKLVRDAAGSVDRIAGDLRASNLGDVVASVTTFARKQPVAFFAGSVLAGFVLARFFKSEPAHEVVARDTQT
ncbi:hypothetical protein [Lichenifustis flavocetrariae]|uniref:Apolipoprotein A1/A4/E family protein n=1 Tax=Lichenifustis flavocetrariae TaxID=2949735 RepID=A0AA41YWL1_9HYPH|nr:hypothetical protein [Lichenifustis flavocetrariae]MCW6509459.1 apolipoprotein A1/A4/E family protein [Lichenifustis flavocetrariae]